MESMTTRAGTFGFRRPATLALVGVFALGVLAGVGVYLNRPDGAVSHTPDTSAWPVHIVLTVVAVAWIAAVVATRSRYRWLTPVNVFGAGFSIRLRLLTRMPVRTEYVRMALVAMMVLFTAFAFFRAGQQVIGGLDPHFIANAWGGPSYLGALYCHYLDLGLMVGVAGVILNLELPRYELVRLDPASRL